MKDKDKIINKFLKEENPSDKLISNIKEIIIDCSNKYYNGESSPLTDEEFDNIYNKYQKIEGDIPSINLNKNSKRNKNLVDTEHIFPQLVGTLDKTNYVSNKDREESGNINTNTVQEWLKSLNLDTTKEYEFYISWKIDGNSITIVWNDKREVILALTRGRDGFGSDKTEYFKNRKLPDFIPIKKGDKLGIKFEAVTTFDSKIKIEEKLGKEYASPCSLVSGMLSKNDISQDIIDMIELVPIRLQYSNTKINRSTELKMIKSIVEDSDFTSISINPKLDNSEILYDKFDNNIKKCKYNELLKKISNIYKKYTDKYRENLIFPVDGIVFEFVDDKLREKLGRKTDRNNFEFALKFPYDTKKSIIKDIEFYVSTNGTGRITPVAIFEPVKFSRAVCDHVSLANYDRFKELKLAKGDEVIISYHNDVMAYLTRDENVEHVGSPIKFIKTCPMCNEKLKINSTKTFVFCGNKKCPSLRIGKINNYLIKMGIDSVRENTITDLYNAGLVKYIPDLYNLKVKDISNIEGFQEISATNIVNAINSKKEVYDYELLGSLGFKNIGRETCKLITKKFTINEIKKIIDDDFDELSLHLIDINGIADITAVQFEKDFKKNLKIIDKLSNVLTIKEIKNEMKISNDPKAICFTGIRFHDLEPKLEMAGHSIKSSVSKKVDMLVCNNKGSGSTKERKAIELGIPIYDKDEFLNEIIHTLI